MASKRKSSDAGNSDMPKRKRVVLPLSEKVKILDLIRKENKSYIEVAKIFGKNESSIREIAKKEKEIRAGLAVGLPTAKVLSTGRDKALVEMEKALKLWLEDMDRQLVPTDSKMLRQKALSLYKEFSKGSPVTSHTKPFVASKGWLHRFRKRCGLTATQITGEAVSAHETGPLWQMHSRTYIHESGKEAPGDKIWKGRLRVVRGSNAAGHMMELGVGYKLKNPRTLKNTNKIYLPVLWQHNSKRWVTAGVFMEWFHQCCKPQVNEYLEEEGLQFKVQLVIHNAPGHPECVCCENKDVKDVLLLPHTTSMLQPLDQGITLFVKASYVRLVFDHMQSAIDADPNLDMIQCLKSFGIADAVTFIKAAVDELKPETVNACWQNLWSEVVNDFKGLPGIDGEVRKITDATRHVGGEGFTDVLDEEVKVDIKGYQDVFIKEELEELVESSTEEEEEVKTEVEPAVWTLPKFAEVFRIAQTLKEKIMEYDPWMERSIKVTREMTEALQPLQEHFNKLKQKKQQLPITTFFPEVSAFFPSSIEDPQLST